jgi:hypothetical protein
MDDLLLGVFVSYIRAFATLQQSEDTHINVNFERPSLSNFIFTLYKSAARKSWSNAYLFKTLEVSSEQQSRNRRDIETMLGGALDEVIDSFIPWKEISKAYFQSRSATPAPAAAAAAAPAPAPTPTPAPAEAPAKPTLTFGESETVEFETDNEDDEDEERPRIELGEDVALELSEDEEPAAKPTGVVNLNL